MKKSKPQNNHLEDRYYYKKKAKKSKNAKKIKIKKEQKMQKEQQT